MVIKKSEGVTPTERLLARLCEQSFLKLWSYPNPFRDDGKELCDLLAIFDNHVFIFFDRESRQFDKTDKNPLVAWERWRREAVDAQIRSAHGGERYIRQGRGVFLDAALKVPFPLDIHLPSIVVHKLIVAHGAREACKAFSDKNVYGSLGVTYGDGQPPGQLPFMIHLDRSNPVHVFDSHNLPIIFTELDTFFDFTAYLDAKLAAIKKYECLAYCGEEDLLAHYLLNLDSTSKTRFIGPKDGQYDFVMIGEGEWHDFVKLPQYANKKKADEVSYMWDRLIQITCQNALDGTLLGNANLLKGRSAIHEMAKEPRLSRRALSQRIAQAIREFPDKRGLYRKMTFLESHYEEKAYVFLQLQVPDIRDYEHEYRPKRRAILEIACAAAKNAFPRLNTIVGIAIDAPRSAGNRNSEDFLLMDCHDWNDEKRAYYRKANEDWQFFHSAGDLRRTRTMEFPLDNGTN